MFSVLKKELADGEQERAEATLEEAEAVHIALVVFEEIFRGLLPVDGDRVRHASHTAALTALLMAAEVPPLTKQSAMALAQLWAKARAAGATSTTIDAFAAREAVHAQAVMLTCDDRLRRYLERGFGESSVRFFTSRAPN